MQVKAAELTDVVSRLRRVEGQIAGIIRMIEEGRDCRVPGSVEAGFSRVGGLPGVVADFVLDRWDQADLAVQATVVVPVDVLRDRDLRRA